MTTLELPGPTCNPESDSVAIAVLNDTVETSTAEFKNVTEVCSSMCQVVETTAEGMEVDNLGGLSKERVDDLERCIAPDQPSLRSLIYVVSAETPWARVGDPCLSPWGMRTGPLDQLSFLISISEIYNVWSAAKFPRMNFLPLSEQ
jgi:hypothetical protein